ncbi:MAG: polyprenyl synthetase family protein [Pirellulales bacterium]|nr:polyprenyl synthetase family protein [Pirellulales bacterium]
MATAPLDREATSASATAPAADPPVSTAHLKLAPDQRQVREKLREAARLATAALDKTTPLSQARIEQIGRQLLAQFDLPQSYLGWTMVQTLSAFWADQLAGVPVARRLLMLPANSQHRAGCAGDSNQPLADGERCAACVVDEARRQAIALGYQVRVVERASAILTELLSGRVDAVIGVATLDVLEQALDRVLLAGVPCGAVPLPAESGQPIDEDWILEMIGTPQVSRPQTTRTYLHLMRSAARMFSAGELEHLAPRARGGHGPLNGAALDPLSATEAIAYDFLAKGGKHSRPFITLAMHDALTGGRATLADGPAHLAQLPAAVRRTAMSIETFHKASLVHDDIEDDDEFRYGDQTLHRRYGTPTAINVGDYLIGLGYRLVSRETATLGADVSADILDRLADAHMKLSEGQGAELMWRDSGDKRLSPDDALHIYALKTAPAFEAALYAGMRLARPIDGYSEPIGQFARHLGVAFQILNDLGDWNADSHNKLLAAGDVVGGRPTLLWALALERLPRERCAELVDLAARRPMTLDVVSQIKSLYEEAGVFAEAARLIAEHERRAATIANTIEPAELRRLLSYLIEMVLDRPSNRAVGVGPPA